MWDSYLENFGVKKKVANDEKKIVLTILKPLGGKKIPVVYVNNFYFSSVSFL